MDRIFKAYDIRGIYPEEINESMFTKIGAGFVKFLRTRSDDNKSLVTTNDSIHQIKTIVVGRDMRESGVSLANALIQGILQSGVDVIDIGMCSTPMLYYATAFFKADAGAMITASHNPAKYNGIKFCREDAIPVAYDSGLSTVKEIIRSDSICPADKPGNIMYKEIGTEYRKLLIKYSDDIKPMTVVVDAGNGVMGAFLPSLFKQIPCEFIELYFEPDGTFPNHEANPLEASNMRDLQAKVCELEADIGIAFDGDGDRAMYADETGALIPADFITALLAGEMLKRNPGAAILYDLRSSRVVANEITRLGGKPMKCRVGHSYIKKMMRKENAVFAGELSGHFYFKDIHFTDNAEMCMLLVLSLMSNTGKKLSELIAPFRGKYRQSGEINFHVDKKREAIEAVKERFSCCNTIIDSADKEHENNLSADGLSIEAADWWCNIRASNTEPVLRLNLEADTKELLDEKLQTIEQIIKKFT